MKDQAFVTYTLHNSRKPVGQGATEPEIGELAAIIKQDTNECGPSESGYGVDDYPSYHDLRIWVVSVKLCKFLSGMREDFIRPPLVAALGAALSRDPC